MTLQRDGLIVVVHRGDALRDGVKENVIPAMDNFPYKSSTTVMILCIPRYIADNIEFRDALL